MPKSLLYFNEDGKEVDAIYELGIQRPFLSGFSRGVKWKSEKEEISFFEKNAIINACPCIFKPFIILIYTGFSSYEPRVNYARIVDHNGIFIKDLKPDAPASTLVNCERFKEIAKIYRYSYALWEKAEDRTSIYITTEIMMNQGWTQCYEKRIFDEDKLEAAQLIQAWQET
jgi:hypothetical protein